MGIVEIIGIVTGVVTLATVEKSDAVTAKEACQAALLKRQTRGGRRP